MGRRTRTPFPGVAALATIVVAGGVGLGLVISTIVDSEMKRPADIAAKTPDRANAELAANVWPDEAVTREHPSGEIMAIFDYADPVDSGWDMPEDVAAIEPLASEDVLNAASNAEAAAAAVQKAAAETAPATASESAPQGRKSALVQSGLY
ncbi:MAG TPA: hypothetical protein VNR60_11455 [Croceibacterium sp.]|nr:hypothetical protein [Croceibacterium sp.]